MKNERNWKKWIGMFSFCLLLIVAYKVLDNYSEIFAWMGNLKNILMPFIMAFILAYILYIPCKKIEQIYGKCKLKLVSKRKRGLATLTVYVFVVLFIFLVVQFVFPALKESIVDLASNLPGYYNMAIEYFNNVPEDSVLNQLNIPDMFLKIQDINITEKIIEFLTLDNISQYVKGVVDITGIVFDLFVTVVVSVYLILERSDIKSFLVNLSKVTFNKDVNERLSKYYNKTNFVFFKFISSQLLDAFIIGIITSLAMSILKIKYAVLLGFLIGLFNIIPYFGAIVAVTISVIITIFTGGVLKALWMAITIVILQQIDANIINPRILGNSLQLSPILVIFSVTIFGSYFGVLGMFLAVPIAAMIKILIIDFINERKKEIEENPPV